MHSRTTEHGRLSVAARSLMLAVIAVAAIVGYWWLKGFRLRVVGDAKSLRWCRQHIFGDTVAHLTSNNILYAVFEVPYCIVTTTFGIRAWLYVQILLWGLTVVLVYRIGAVLFDERTGVVAGLATAVLWETFRFAVRPQSDLLFLFFLSVTLWSLARWKVDDERKWYAVAIGGMVLLSFTRPFGVAFLLGLVGWLLVRPGERTWIDLTARRTQVSLFAVGVICAIVGIFFLQMQLNAAHTDPDVYWRKSLVAKWASGIVVTHPGTPTFEYVYTPRSAPGLLPWIVANADHLLAMALLKAAFFFVPVLPRWSTFHIIVNLVTLFPLILGTFAGTWLVLRRRLYDTAGLLMIPIFVVVATVAVTFLDGGFNYRAPATLSFALLSGYTVTSVLTRTRLQTAVSAVSPR